MRKRIGAEGEALAIAHLKAKDYHIVEQNWHCQRGEIDIVARDGEVWVFCEVKTRRASSTQSALVNITAKKQEKMILAAQEYLHEHQLEDVIWRIDAIAVALPTNSEPIIDHVEDVLDW
ncbi:MAG: YraN family protein [Chloroflexota bacterium]